MNSCHSGIVHSPLHGGGQYLVQAFVMGLLCIQRAAMFRKCRHAPLFNTQKKRSAGTFLTIAVNINAISIQLI